MMNLKQKERDEKIVKCACGLPMRQRNWSDHWRTCRIGSSVPVTEEDVAALIQDEERRRLDALEHKRWLDEGGATKGRLCVKGGTLAVEG